MARILVIEDDDGVRGLLLQILEGAGYEVVGTTEGEEGIRAYRREPADLVITDIMMPEKDGVEIIRELRRDYPDVRIIAITGFRGRFNRLPAAEYLGAQRTFLKPFSTQEMLEAVREVLDQD